VAYAAAPAAAVYQAVHDTAVDAPAPAIEPFAFALALEHTPEPVHVFEQPKTQSPFEPVVEASQAAVSSNPTEDYIAAARRMHQASQQASLQKGGILGGLAPGVGKSDDISSKKLKSFKLPFMRSGKAEPALKLPGDLKVTPDVKPANNNSSHTRKNLILMGLVVLGLVSSIMAKNFFAGSAQNALEPVAIEQPMFCHKLHL